MKQESKGRLVGESEDCERVCVNSKGFVALANFEDAEKRNRYSSKEEYGIPRGRS
jgi:hypothetical protein